MKRRIKKLVGNMVMWCVASLYVLHGLLQVLFILAMALSALSWLFWLVASPIRVHLSFSESMREKELAEKAVQIYQTRINEGRCQENFNQASENLRSDSNFQRVVLMPCKERQYFGSVKSTYLIDSHIGFDFKGRFIELTCKTSFSNDVSQVEKFTWRTENNQLVIDNYRIVNPYENISL